MIRLMVCDDHEMVRTALVRALQADARFTVVAEADSAAGLLAQLGGDTAIDVLLLDLSLGRDGVAAGLQTLEQVIARRPELPVLVVSMHDEPEIVRRVLQGGARGYVTKDSSIDVLQEAILQVVQGRRFLDPNLVEPVVTRAAAPARASWDAPLTPREREVLQLISGGQRLRDIAVQLGLSVKTVSTHKMRLMQKLDVTNNADLIRFCVEHGVR
jgi:DNA-binding NarL/FixJ family response regulator